MQVKRMVTGMALAVTAGGSFGHAYLSDYPSWWALGATVLVAATHRVVSALSADPPRVEEWMPQPGPGDASKLGDVLIRLGRITPRQLNSALAQQRRTQKPMDQVLLEMRMVTPQQIDEILKKQRRDVFVWRAGGN